MTMSRGTLDGDAHPAGPPLPPGGQRRRLTLAGFPKPVARARGFTAEAVGDWYLPDVHEGVGADVVLLVAELVANAMLHGDGPLELVLDATGERLRVEVSDRSPAMPALRHPHDPALPGGHGLFIVQRTADRWGAEPHGQGKTIWAEFDARRLTRA
ncbi:ATP-binding protein [Streptomyces sp. CBMA156]|uniref:ATP-binding protein n=1 Tax=Streptomyces sp. CBMA156 TaxID=1930280 RepID=UPI001661E2BD|nr:ATP-binding protein [Streptomyces sp. CBMA156]MBD0671822.1 anti-sigma factor [Streptomyces sp. CBMA156]